APLDVVATMMLSAVTDHVFMDGGHTVDVTDTAFAALDHLGPASAGHVLPSLVARTAAAERSEEFGSWRHPHDLPALIGEAERRLSSTVPPGDTELANGATFGDADVTALAWLLLGEEPEPVVNAIVDAHTRRASAEQLGRALALAAALRI